jgi:hypothetical protein
VRAASSLTVVSEERLEVLDLACWAAAAFAFCETQLPKALACFLPVPYFVANAAAMSVGS